MAPKRLVAEMPWDAVRDALAAGSPAILPIGAGSKQHGFHLPLSTDARQAEWFALQTAELCEGLIWPTLNYGYYPNFDLYPGSVSTRETTFRELVLDIVESLLAQTKSWVFIVNSGISTIPPIGDAVSRCQSPQRVFQLDLYRGACFLRVRDSLIPRQAGGHADEIETSVMLAIDSKSVDLMRAVPSEVGRGLSAGKLSPVDISSPNFTSSGSVGEPGLATLEIGDRVLAAMLDDAKALVSYASRTTGSGARPVVGQR